MRVTMASRGLDAALSVEPGHTLALLGPNGSGKSSVLSALAGLLRPESGSAFLGEKALFDIPARSDGQGRRGQWLEPHDRPLGLLGQDPLLFPHLSALDNVAFPARAGGSSAADARAQGRHWLRRVDAEHLAQSRPGQLSGGQAQRVAIARALAATPTIMLLDEPLAALDIDAGATVRAVLADVLRERTAIFATHDVVDASMLADDIAVLHEGRVVEAGPTATVLGQPQHAFTARMAGRGLLRGTRTVDGIELPDGTRLRARQADDAAPGTRVLLTVRPRDVQLAGTQNSLSGVVDLVEGRDGALRVWAGGLITDVDLDVARTHAPHVGQRVHLQVNPDAAVVYAQTA